MKGLFFLQLFILKIPKNEKIEKTLVPGKQLEFNSSKKNDLEGYNLVF